MLQTYLLMSAQNKTTKQKQNDAQQNRTKRMHLGVPLLINVHF